MQDARIAPLLSEKAKQRLSADSWEPQVDLACYERTKKSFAQIMRRVPILAGTDTPNDTTTFGASLHEELELLVDAGLTPEEALASATSVPAGIFHLADRGTIAKGSRADFVLVTGDPASDIRETRSVERVYKGGMRSR